MSRVVVNKVRLCTEDGQLVTELIAPPFQKKPSVIIWGDRVFSSSAMMETLGVEEYREVFAWAVALDPHG